MWRCLLLTAALILSGQLCSSDAHGAEPAAAKPVLSQKIRVAAVQMRSTRDLSEKSARSTTFCALCPGRIEGRRISGMRADRLFRRCLHASHYGRTAR